MSTRNIITYADPDTFYLKSKTSKNNFLEIINNILLNFIKTKVD